jgi:hypothetical protein
VNIEIHEEPFSVLCEHAKIPISFEVDCVFDVSPADEGGGGFVLQERRLAVPYLKDYDLDNGPMLWGERFDVSCWGLIAAYIDDKRVGGVVVACDTPNLSLLEGRSDVALLWDIRVHPEFCRTGWARASSRGSKDGLEHEGVGT